MSNTTALYNTAKETFIKMAMLPRFIQGNIDGLIDYYTESWREYHNEKHIADMILGATILRWDFDPLLMFCILMHDLYYVPNNTGSGIGDNKCGNEWYSGEMARFILEDCFLQYSGSCDDLVVSAAIKKTAHFMEIQTDLTEMEKRLLDLDLSSLALEKYEDFVKQQERIQKESQARIPSNQIVLDPKKTADFLEAFYNARGGEFFYTDGAKALWRDTARSNVLRYIEEYKVSYAP